MSRRTYKAYGIALAVLWVYVIVGVFYAAVVYPSASSGEPPTRTVTIGFGQ